jgi:hypothetical protein
VRLNDIGATVYKWHRVSVTQAQVRTRRQASSTHTHTQQLYNARATVGDLSSAYTALGERIKRVADMCVRMKSVLDQIHSDQDVEV